MPVVGVVSAGDDARALREVRLQHVSELDVVHHLRNEVDVKHKVSFCDGDMFWEREQITAKVPCPRRRCQARLDELRLAAVDPYHAAAKLAPDEVRDCADPAAQVDKERLIINLSESSSSERDEARRTNVTRDCGKCPVRVRIRVLFKRIAKRKFVSFIRRVVLLHFTLVVGRGGLDFFLRAFDVY